jgi:hypothetical protein
LVVTDTDARPRALATPVVHATNDEPTAVTAHAVPPMLTVVDASKPAPVKTRLRPPAALAVATDGAETTADRSDGVAVIAPFPPVMTTVDAEAMAALEASTQQWATPAPTTLPAQATPFTVTADGAGIWSVVVRVKPGTTNEYAVYVVAAALA